MIEEQKIQRDEHGFIMETCIKEMRNSLPIELFVNQDKEPCYVARTEDELAHYFNGALPYCLTTKWRKINDQNY